MTPFAKQNKLLPRILFDLLNFSADRTKQLKDPVEQDISVCHQVFF